MQKILPQTCSTNLFYFFSKILLAAVLLFSISCRAQIRNSENISKDKFFQFFSEKLEKQKRRIPAGLKKSNLPEDQNDLALLYIRKGRIEKGVSILDKITRSEFKSIIPYMNLGRILFLAGDTDELSLLYGRLKKSQILSDAALLDLAKKLYGENRASESLRLAEVLGASSDDVRGESYLFLSKRYLETGEYSNSLRYFDQILTLQPNHPEALFSSGYIYYLGNDCRRALYFFNEAQKNGRNGYDIHFFSADCYTKEMNFKKALREINFLKANELTYESVLLKGRILLSLNYAADLSGLLAGRSEEEQRSLLSHWYGVGSNTKIENLKKIQKYIQIIH